MEKIINGILKHILQYNCNRLRVNILCGLSTLEIARAFLVSEPTMAQRLARAKGKISDAGVPFELPAPQFWPERLDAVLATIEIAYGKAHGERATRSFRGRDAGADQHPGSPLAARTRACCGGRDDSVG
jgi:predicted RNA polymerase sigma factor